jgi:hypothetical protein
MEHTLSAALSSLMQQQVTLSACEATGYSNVSICLNFNGKPVHDKGSIFDHSGEFVSADTFTLQAAQLPPRGVAFGAQFSALAAPRIFQRASASASRRGFCAYTTQRDSSLHGPDSDPGRGERQKHH